jgi:hypothetical protein
MSLPLRPEPMVQLLTRGDPAGNCASRVACCDVGRRITSASSPECALDMRHVIK